MNPRVRDFKCFIYIRCIRVEFFFFISSIADANRNSSRIAIMNSDSEP